MHSAVWPVFLLLTVGLGGAAAAATGRAVARSWSPTWHLFLYLPLLAAAVRFLHYALFAGPIDSVADYAIDLAIIALIAFAAYRATRARQMAAQYGFLLEASSGYLNPLTFPAARSASEPDP